MTRAEILCRRSSPRRPAAFLLRGERTSAVVQNLQAVNQFLERITSVATNCRLLQNYSMLDLAPGWIIKCTKCGKQKPLGETGAIRLGAASVGKRTLAWCSKCNSLRWAAIERSEQPGDNSG